MNPCRSESCQSADEEVCVSEELRRGRQAATDLLGLIRQQTYLSTANASSGASDPASGLVMRIIDSFSNSLSMLGCQDPAAARGPSESNKNSSSSSSSGGRKCLKPRKGDSWSYVTSALIADGYAWRKYGQKPILNAKYPRSYFKCTNTPHCQALKRVQQMDDDPPMYKITHTGHHTCENPSNPSSVINNKDSSIMFNFEMPEYNDEQSNSSDRLATGLSPPQFGRIREEESKNQLPGSSSTPDNLPILENMETVMTSAPKDEQWSSFDDFDYLIGSLEFNEHAS